MIWSSRRSRRSRLEDSRSKYLSLGQSLGWDLFLIKISLYAILIIMSMCVFCHYRLDDSDDEENGLQSSLTVPSTSGTGR